MLLVGSLCLPEDDPYESWLGTTTLIAAHNTAILTAPGATDRSQEDGCLDNDSGVEGKLASRERVLDLRAGYMHGTGNGWLSYQSEFLITE